MKPNKPGKLDVDARFLLANERTLLAWVRTALAIEAGGLALTALHPSNTGQVFGIIILLMGAGVAILGYARFHATDKAIRAHRLPTTGHGPAIGVIGVVVVAVVLAIAQVTVLR